MDTSSLPASKKLFQKLADWLRSAGLAPLLYSESLQLCIASAQQLASNLGPAPCTPLHMLLALSLSKRGIAAQILQSLNFHGESAARKITAKIHADQQVAIPHSRTGYSSSFKILVALAARQAKRRREDYVGTQHVLFALTERDDQCQDLLRSHGIEATSLLSAFEGLAKGRQLVD